MSSVVVDTSAILAFLYEEPGSDRVQSRLINDDALISSVNYAELIGRLAMNGHNNATIDTIINSLGLKLVEQDLPQATLAGQLIRETKAHGLSLADRACLALAITRHRPALTADRAWADLSIEHLTVDVIR